MPKLIPNLWFDDNAMEAAEFYVSIFPNSRIANVMHYTDAGPGVPGTVMAVDFELDGQTHTGINGGPLFTFSEAVSLLVDCHGQDEIDRYWDALLAGGGEPSQCGWLKDKFGFSWQVADNAAMLECFNDPDQSRVQRAMQAMFSMQKLDLAALRAAADA